MKQLIFWWLLHVTFISDYRL